MKIFIIGLGSIGQRHARNLRALLGDSVDLIAWRSRGLEWADERTLGIRRVSDVDAGLSEHPDAVFITNPSALHLEVAQAAANAGCALFIEKPLADRWNGVDQLLETVEKRHSVAMVGYQLRFHPGLARLRELLKDGAIGRVLSARLDFGEYLPQWHPYEDYRESYAARRRLGGGVLLTQIHEFDYLYWLWGMPERVYASGGRLTRLETDVEDYVIAQMEFGRDASIALASVHLDYLRRPAVRTCDVIGEEGRLSLDLLDGRLSEIRPDAAVRVEHYEFTRNDLFVAELRHFLRCLAGGAQPVVSLQDGAMSLKLALAARRSLETHAPIELMTDAVFAD